MLGLSKKVKTPNSDLEVVTEVKLVKETSVNQKSDILDNSFINPLNKTSDSFMGARILSEQQDHIIASRQTYKSR